MVRRTDIAWRNLVRERGRLVISVGGVAFAVLLILVLRGLYAGFVQQATAYVRSVDADVWVAQQGTPGDFGHSVSLLAPTVVDEIGAVDGVDRAAPLLTRPLVFSLGGDDVDLFLVGVDLESGFGGPPGEDRLTASGQIVVDEVFARNNGVDRGETLDVAGRRLTVVGIARGGNAVITQYAWASLDDVAAITDAGDTISYVLVKASPGRTAAQLAADISAAVPGTKAITEDDFAAANAEDISEGFLPILWVLVIIGVVIGTAVIGLTIYTATIEKRREYGVLKAIGFSNRRLVAIVWRQSLVAAGFGLIAGVGLTYAVAAAIQAALPAFVTDIRAGDIALVAVASMLMAIVASFVPVRPVIRLDPAEVFRV